MSKAIDEIIRIDESMAEETVSIYAKVFSGAPWYEEMKCAAKNCGTAYGTPDEKERGYAEIEAAGICKNSKCKVNDANDPTTLELVPFYTGDDQYGLDIFKEATSMDDFIGFIGKKDDELIGFSWGYKVPEVNTESVWFAEIPEEKLIEEGRLPVIELLKKYNINPGSTFYAAETGVAENARTGGVATTLSSTRVCEARDLGYENVVFRTKNAVLIKTFQKIFGKQGLTTLFEDPNPAKEGTMWYLMRTADLK